MGTTYMDFSTGVFHVDGDAPLTQAQVDSVWRHLPTTGASWVERGNLFVQQFDGAKVFNLGPVERGVKGASDKLRFGGHSKRRHATKKTKKSVVVATPSPSRHHASKKKSPAQLQREIDEVLSKPSGSARSATSRDQQLAEAIDSGSRERAAALYGIWTSQYSNEDMDRISSLAGRLTDIDRQEGRAAPPVGSSRTRLDQAKQVVRDANSYGAFQQGLAAQRRAKR